MTSCFFPIISAPLSSDPERPKGGELYSNSACHSGGVELGGWTAGAIFVKTDPRRMKDNNPTQAQFLSFSFVHTHATAVIL